MFGMVLLPVLALLQGAVVLWMFVFIRDHPAFLLALQRLSLSCCTTPLQPAGGLFGVPGGYCFQSHAAVSRRLLPRLSETVVLQSQIAHYCLWEQQGANPTTALFHAGVDTAIRHVLVYSIWLWR